MTSEAPDAPVEWWLRHPTLATLAAAGSTLVLGSAVLWWHVSTVVDTPSAPHVVGGDFALFGMVAALLVLATGIVISRQRQS